jgi:hypothetical protein
MTFLSGCFANYARFSQNKEINQAFRIGGVPLELNYFYAGPKSNPHAIMGIDPLFTVQSTLWVAFDPEPEQLRQMSASIYGGESREPNGFDLLSEDGVFIGIWFSSLHFPRVRVDRENRTIAVPFSSPAIYNLR